MALKTTSHDVHLAQNASERVSAKAQRSEEAVSLQSKLSRMLETLGNIRDEERLNAEEILIFLAVGALGISVTAMGMEVRPVPCGQVSDVLHIPKETVRRRIVSLNKRRFATMTTNGVNILDPGAWLSIGEAVVKAVN